MRKKGIFAEERDLRERTEIREIRERRWSMVEGRCGGLRRLAAVASLAWICVAVR
ncbi:hypothetical protein A2U01_0045112, partial [Trifolium medium]|nr:hypothetical protein [Trifolium medium]